MNSTCSFASVSNKSILNASPVRKSVVWDKFFKCLHLTLYKEGVSCKKLYVEQSRLLKLDVPNSTLPPLNNGRPYSIPKIIEILVSRNNWSYKDAADYFFYSIDDVYHGDKAPLFINLINDKEWNQLVKILLSKILTKK